ncbi:acetyl-CoA carboxylase biotin carboxyl carrier protein [Micromonospora yasonensis]|uniref:acetyl-CoA carboxylase biotin carboxyl carrier protein n=1 Tax=Micromonospora yasonensis TaxID=1128667 RepID=UPI002231DCB3|nr:acetyl-CoA carboxylase biotin carboxyl carrier protein [Micromonospora yasonensis]MCW3843237.1 acetyl-CoA carboxylase biotin carboxyl carrier protein [Micromonospora yasonensis]
MSGERSKEAGDERSNDVQDVLDAVMRLRAESRNESGRRPSRLRVESGDAAVELEWWNGDRPGAPAAVRPPTTTAAAAEPQPASASAESNAPVQPETGQSHVKSPMVGTFYHAPSPEDPPFVKVGDVVSPGQQVGIVEAMKLMNPIEADQAGRVVEVLVPNASLVEYDQPLIALVPVDET